nr:MAG TPA: hypothetical protein [Caudoviricetes sp.]
MAACPQSVYRLCDSPGLYRLSEQHGSCWPR